MILNASKLRNFKSNKLLQFLRCYAATNSIKLENINHFGLLSVHCSKYNAFIKSIDVHSVPNGDKAFITLINNSISSDINTLLEVTYDKESSELNITSKNDLHVDGIEFEVQVPHNFDIDVLAKNVNIKETEGHCLKVQASENCNLGKIKSFEIELDIKGNLKCKNLYGSGVVNTKGTVDIGKIQTKDIQITTKDQDIQISDIYSNNISCKTVNGNIKLGNLHGNCQVDTFSGDISIDSSTGDLNVNSENGNVKISLESFNNCEIKTITGDIDVGFSTLISTCIEAQAKSFDIPETLVIDGMKRESGNTHYFEGKLGDGKSEMKILTEDGNISLSRKNWFSKFEMLD